MNPAGEYWFTDSSISGTLARCSDQSSRSRAAAGLHLSSPVRLLVAALVLALAATTAPTIDGGGNRLSETAAGRVASLTAGRAFDRLHVRRARPAAERDQHEVGLDAPRPGLDVRRRWQPALGDRRCGDRDLRLRRSRPARLRRLPGQPGLRLDVRRGRQHPDRRRPVGQQTFATTSPTGSRPAPGSPTTPTAASSPTAATAATRQLRRLGALTASWPRPSPRATPSTARATACPRRPTARPRRSTSTCGSPTRPCSPTASATTCRATPPPASAPRAPGRAPSPISPARHCSRSPRPGPPPRCGDRTGSRAAGPAPAASATRASGRTRGSGHLRFRAYDPALLRFTGRDTWAASSSTPGTPTATRPPRATRSATPTLGRLRPDPRRRPGRGHRAHVDVSPLGLAHWGSLPPWLRPADRAHPRTLRADRRRGRVGGHSRSPPRRPGVRVARRAAASHAHPGLAREARVADDLIAGTGGGSLGRRAPIRGRRHRGRRPRVAPGVRGGRAAAGTGSGRGRTFYRAMRDEHFVALGQRVASQRPRSHSYRRRWNSRLGSEEG